MGLDMYLKAKRYLSSYDKEDQVIREKIKGINELDTLGMELSEITCQAMYWRKANAIHQWFVDNVQDGTDDCENYDVSDRQLEELLALCKTVLIERSRAQELLPTQSGFFFGQTEYDEGYFGDLDYTASAIERLLLKTKGKGWDFEYHSSW